MENNLEQYNSKRHKIFTLWEYTKQLLGFINTLENRTDNLEKQIKSLNIGTNKSGGVKKIEIDLSSFSNLNDGSSIQQTRGNTILTLQTPTGSWDATVILITYVHNLNITSYPILASLQYVLDSTITFPYKEYLSSTYIYSFTNNRITLALPGHYQFSGESYNLSNGKIILMY